jgi:hypothetical protein
MSYIAIAVVGFLVLACVFVSGMFLGLLLATRLLLHGSGEQLQHRIASHVAAGVLRQRAEADAKRRAN